MILFEERRQLKNKQIKIVDLSRIMFSILTITSCSTTLFRTVFRFQNNLEVFLMVMEGQTKVHHNIATTVSLNRVAFSRMVLKT